MNSRDLGQTVDRLIAAIGRGLSDQIESEALRGALAESRAWGRFSGFRIGFVTEALLKGDPALSFIDNCKAAEVAFKSWLAAKNAEGIHYSLRFEGWSLNFASDFVRALDGLDRKLQGRVLEALTVIASDPTVPRGDTVKPLVGDLDGLWRYRLGDWRLIYLPVPSDHAVRILRLSPRGDAYS